MRVIKFGGTSIGTVSRFKNVIKIISDRLEKENIIVVISAIEGVTNKIISAIELASSGNKDYQNILNEINKIHCDFLAPLVRDKEYFHTKLAVDSVLRQLNQILKGVFLLKECSPRISDSAVSIGEYLSKCILVGALNSNGLAAEGIDAAGIIKTNSGFGKADVDFDLTDSLIKRKFTDKEPGTIQVINGFTGSNCLGEITTLGRSGSDYTATIIAAALRANLVEIWTDVDGILSADPKIVPEASTLSKLSYEEAADLAHLGAKVIFSKTMAPAEKAGIPIMVLNTFQPDNPGTYIGKIKGGEDAGVKAIACRQNLSLVCLNEISPEFNLIILSRLFNLLARLENPTILFNQSASNQSFCFVTLASRISILMNEIQKEFKLELETGKAGRITFRNDIAVISVAGGKLESHTALLKKIFETLDENKIKSLLFLNNSSHKNVSFVIEKPDTEKTVTALHESFFGKRAEINRAKINSGK